MRIVLRLVAVASYIFAAICAVGLIVMALNYGNIKGSPVTAFACTAFGLFFFSGFGAFFWHLAGHARLRRIV